MVLPSSPPGEMPEIHKKVIYTTDLNADSVEWCPINNYKHIFVCATYQLSSTVANCKGEGELDENEKTLTELRKGDLYLFELVQGPEVIRQLQKIPLIGILDCKWAHRELCNNIYLAIATAVGDMRLYKLKDDGAVQLEHVQTHKLCSSSSIIALSLDWSTGRSDSDVKILVSDSEGFITLLTFADGQITEECKWKIHDFQAWIVCFNYWDTNTFYSGGDDSRLYIYDRRDNKVDRNDIAHSAGVTSMHCNLNKEHLLVSGSYDEKINFWDTRKMDIPSTTIQAGGGVWRLKWEPLKSDDVAAACMHNGFSIADGINCSVHAEYKEHTSLAYGIDWSHLEVTDLSTYFDIAPNKAYSALAMCSFYDNMLSVALFQKDK